MNEMVQITPRDMVAVALKPQKSGETVSYGNGSITLREDIPMGHKAALRDIRKGEAVIKYGFPIGEATEDIPAGAHVHIPGRRAGRASGTSCGSYRRWAASATWQKRWPGRRSG